MLKLTVIELFLRLFPEITLYLLFSYVVARREFDVKKIAISVSSLSVLVYFIRKLPIQFGIHTILFMVLLIIALVKLNGFAVNKAIGTSLIALVLLAVSDVISVVIITGVLKMDIAPIMQDPVKKLLFGLPSLAVFAVIVFVVYKVMNRKGRVTQTV